MKSTNRILFWLPCFFVISSAAVVTIPSGVFAQQPVVPGTGKLVEDVGDDFEDPQWNYIANLPKLYNVKDDPVSKNSPSGRSENGRWYEGMKRGQPDQMRRVETPAGGIAGSTGALALRSLHTGIAGQPSYDQQQDDFVANVPRNIGKISVSRIPSVVTRVWLPPVDQWENRTGCHFAFRIALETTPPPSQRGGLFFRADEDEFDGTYWPGIFINFDSKEGRGATRQQYDSGYMWLKASSSSHAIRGPQITTTGWWTLGMSVTPDGQVHYYARPGVEDLTEADHIASSFPFGYRALRFRTFFFNVCNGDDGRTWSSEFVIDDPQLYVVH